MQGNSSQFSAVDPALGYLYQIRSALLWSLQRLKQGSDFLVSVEILDDVAFEPTVGDPTEFLQTKHHRSTEASLTDAGPDLWKTLRIWFEGTANGTIPTTTLFSLVTTSMAQPNSIGAFLRPNERDVAKAKTRLDEVAASSNNQTNAAAYKAYLDTPHSRRLALLNRIVVYDASPTVASLESLLLEEVFWAAGRKNREAFLERLEGWWLRRVIRQLVADASNRIGSVEIEAQMADLREQFKSDSLPIDSDLLEFVLDEATRQAHEGLDFVRQLELIKASSVRIAAAIRDYYRASEQRSRWLRLDLAVELEQTQYEARLVDEWQYVFEAMRDELGDSATDAAMESAARGVLSWAEQTIFPIRSGMSEPFISRGSFHRLANERSSDKSTLRIGWHPAFHTRLAQLLAKSGGAE